MPATPKWVYSVRWKFLLFAIGSAAITAVLLYLGYALGNLILKTAFVSRPIASFVRFPVALVVNKVGSSPAAIAAGFVIYVVSFFLLSRGTMRRLESLERSIRSIGMGNFDQNTPNRAAKDEIGQLSNSVYRMSAQLSDDLSHILAGLQEIANGNLDRPIPAGERSGELAEVAFKINEMAERLHRTIQDERNAEKTKNDLITGVSHDLRTPLTSILGFLEVIHEDRYRDEVELRHYMTIVYEKSLTLKKLIDDLFEYTRVNNGIPLNTVQLDLIGFIRQLCEEFVPQLEAAGMTCRVEAELDALVIDADGDLLVRSFENFLSNAIRYGQDGRYIDISFNVSEGEAIVNIANYGEPIPERDLPFLFDRFYRVDRSRSKETGGTGLGLAIAKSIIEVHGGRISVQSSRDRTVFTTRLPLHS
ncbi:sensor histidine kinase [Cohnella silvisoli]|uniref:histidine kinase n=1 Tax=Cohnella silvisoli TaxID=2873699 RepID=A0ABV1KUW1_9BACL|nr:ATP-binding protein [Cohnella silvisoli]MCD9022990.1 HAMP domain-containing protein [Cohnella silvisoli]